MLGKLKAGTPLDALATADGLKIETGGRAQARRPAGTMSPR